MSDAPKQLSPAGQKVALAVICLIFISVGLSLWIPMFVVPLLDWQRMKTWKERPCTIVHGQGDTAEGTVLFRYEYDEQTYEASGLGTVDFGPAVWSLQRGMSTVCYVNPRAPREAVLFNRFDPEIFMWCAPLLFVIIPLAALMLGLRKRPPEPEVDPNSIVLEKRRMSGCGFVVLFVFLICFGGASALILLIPGFAESPIFRIFYLVPTAVPTVFILIGLIRSFLGLFRPTVTLTVGPRAAVPGQMVEVRWQAKGPIERAKSFLITLEGRQETRYRVDGRFKTEIERFATIEVAKGGPKDLRRGSVKVRIPPETMHSFSHGGRRIIWVFRVAGEIPSWPAEGMEFPYELTWRRGEKT